MGLQSRIAWKMCVGNDCALFLAIQALTAYLKRMQVCSSAKHCCRWEQCNWLQRAVMSFHSQKVHQQLLNTSKVCKQARDVPVWHTTGIQDRVHQGMNRSIIAVFFSFCPENLLLVTLRGHVVIFMFVQKREG